MIRVDFQSIEEFAKWLNKGGIETATWGHGKAKRIEDLWREYLNGESTFNGYPIYRLVEVVQIYFRRDGTVLIEVEQEFNDGRRRVRFRPPAEKMKRGETPRAAALRCLREELGLSEDEVELGEGRAAIEEIVVSTSYPGLPTHYQFYTFEATTDSLPDTDFYRENIPGDPISHHLWGWRPQI